MGGRYLQHAELRNTYHILSDNLCCKIASEDRILVLLVVCTVERHALNLNQSIVELFPSFFFVKQRLILYPKGKRGRYNDTV